MSDPADTTLRIIQQGKALVRAIEALTTIDSTGWFETALTRLLLAAYKRRLRAVVAAAPEWVVEEILSASEHIGGDRMIDRIVWMSDN